LPCCVVWYMYIHICWSVAEIWCRLLQISQPFSSSILKNSKDEDDTFSATNLHCIISQKTDICTHLCGKLGLILPFVLLTCVQCLRTVSTLVKQPGHHVNHSPPSGAEVKNGWIYTSAPCIHLHGVDRNFFFYSGYKNIILRTAGHTLPTFCSGHGGFWCAGIVHDIRESNLFCIAAGATRTTSINGVTAPLCLCCSSRSFA